MPDVQYTPDGSLILSESVQIPDVLDLLVVGGGPAGTAAAFRAKELGLSTLVIDYDDLMKRIRDYPKDKLILPDFGGGDQMRFPKGGDLITALHFSPLDKDEMVNEWKRLYVTYNVPAQVGIELLGLTQRGDGVWEVRTWNHNIKKEQQVLAKHVAIGIGRGVPRRFDIPGNTDGIAYRLDDALAYVGSPSLVIGGGTSAAEAVIAISNAKAKFNDTSAVYWSYRSEKLPKVSKALADVFFEAYIGNGNIRYYPNSEPVAVVTADDKKDYLSLRVDRKLIASRPNETLHLEFPKESCIACIGEDIPETFLNSMGISMVTGGAANKKRMCVTPLLETQQPNVYLIGDILSQAYLETENFAADPATFNEVKHRGNIKAALVDGVLVAEVVAQRVAGKKEIDVKIDFIEEVSGPRQPVTPNPVTRILTVPPGMKQAEVVQPVEQNRAYLARIIVGSVEGEEFPVAMNGITTIGKKFCDIVFPDDPFLSDRHASIVHGPDGFFIRDDGSESGVFVRATEGKSIEVSSSDLVRVGKQFLLFRNDENGAVFSQFDAVGKFVKLFPLKENTIVVGRDAPDITLDTKDLTLSRRHLAISLKQGRISIKDLKSVNGTYLKVRNMLRIEPEDIFRVGGQTFKLLVRQERSTKSIRITTSPFARGDVTTRETHAQVEPTGAAKPAAPATPVAAPAAAGNVIVFKNVGKTLAFAPGETICSVAEKNGIKIVAECHAGICGSDPIRIISGGDKLNAMSAAEKEALEDICGLGTADHRLACMAKPTGSVEVEIVKG
jgi:pSer/pThr/pTyr-binding forkhead associated (FHA) protein/thioredoxin reductase/ferredoxin